MVIISKDDYISFLNEFGGKMQTPPVNVNSNVSIATTTATLPSSTGINKFYNNNEQQLQQQPSSPQMQQHIERLREVMQESKVANGGGGGVGGGNNKVLQTARAILLCRPNSHPFQNRSLYLEPNVEVKIGRSVARTKVSESNAIFDCKVLSRNHAVIWYADGKFFLKDTGSSNGTFINNNRLSPTTVQSEPFEVSSGDIVQFGVDVMENSRKETHGCIVATLKLFLPDGRETKASHSTMVGAVSTNIEPSDLHRLNQYVQEIVQRDQIMETKLMSIQKTVDKTRKNSSLSWQALIDEDRLLSRIDMLEKKLQCMQKNVSDDKLREEVLKMQEEKLVYETTAKDALRKVYQERSDAIQRLTAIQRALCTSENECSLLRELVAKLNQEIQDLTEKFSTVQKQFDEKMIEAQENDCGKEVEINGLKDELKMLQERIVLLQETCDSDDSNDSLKVQIRGHLTDKRDVEKVDKMSSILENSNIMEMKDSLDIINAICNEPEYKTMDESWEFLDSAAGKIYKKILNLESIVSRMEESYPRKSSQDSNIVENSQTEENNSTSVCDGNQNLNNTSTVLAASTDAKLMKKSLKVLKNSFIDLMKVYNRTNLDQQNETTKLAEGADDAGEGKESLEKIKSELEMRPSLQEYKEKIDLIDELSEKLTLTETSNLAFKLELTNNKTKIESLQDELAGMMKAQSERNDAVVQTEVVAVVVEKATSAATTTTTTTTTTEAVPSGVEEILCENAEESCDGAVINEELSLIHHPDVQREEELVLFKEKYTKLVEEKLSIDKELANLRDDYQQYRNKSLTQLLMYLAPFFALIAYLFVHYCK